MPRSPSDTPGLEIAVRNGRRIPRWRARKEAVKLGFKPSTQRLNIDPDNLDELGKKCRELWAEMEAWLDTQPRTDVPTWDGTIGCLIETYKVDPYSPYQALSHGSRQAYDYDLGVLLKTVGERRLDKLTGKDFRRWYDNLRRPAQPGGPERIRRAAGVMTMLRILVGYGVESDIAHCDRLKLILGSMRFKGPGHRTQFLTYEQAAAIIAKAHELGFPEIALGQALQFEATLRQSDVIGQWIPDPDAPHRSRWTGGLLWGQHISKDYILEKRTTKRGVLSHVDLKGYPLALAELQNVPIERRVGPVIIDSRTGAPFKEGLYARRWRVIARAAGVPDNIWNRDSRAGGVTEGSDAGADMELLRHHASHRSLSSTEVYSRPTLAKTTRVAKLRLAHRERRAQDRIKD